MMFCYTSKVEKAIRKNIEEANKCPNPNDRWNRLHTMSDVIMSLYEAKAINIDVYRDCLFSLRLLKSGARIDGSISKIEKSTDLLKEISAKSFERVTR